MTVCCIHTFIERRLVVLGKIDTGVALTEGSVKSQLRFMYVMIGIT